MCVRHTFCTIHMNFKFAWATILNILDFKNKYSKLSIEKKMTFFWLLIHYLTQLNSISLQNTIWWCKFMWCFCSPDYCTKSFSFVKLKEKIEEIIKNILIDCMENHLFKFRFICFSSTCNHHYLQIILWVLYCLLSNNIVIPYFLHLNRFCFYKNGNYDQLSVIEVFIQIEYISIYLFMVRACLCFVLFAARITKYWSW